MAEHVDQILDRGTPAQRKALIEQLIEEIQIVGPSRIRPIYRVPHPSKDAEPAADDGTTVRTIGNLMGPAGPSRGALAGPSDPPLRHDRPERDEIPSLSDGSQPA